MPSLAGDGGAGSRRGCPVPACLHRNQPYGGTYPSWPDTGHPPQGLCKPAAPTGIDACCSPSPHPRPWSPPTLDSQASRAAAPGQEVSTGPTGHLRFPLIAFIASRKRRQEPAVVHTRRRGVGQSARPVRMLNPQGSAPLDSANFARDVLAWSRRRLAGVADHHPHHRASSGPPGHSPAPGDAPIFMDNH